METGTETLGGFLVERVRQGIIKKHESIREMQRKEKAGKIMWLNELREKGIRFRTFHIVKERFSEIVRIFTDTSQEEQAIGRVVVASRYLPQTSTLMLQFSFCSAKNKFDRKEGQFLAAERLMDKPVDVKLSGNTIDAIKQAILDEGLKRNISWMRNIDMEGIR